MEQEIRALLDTYAKAARAKDAAMMAGIYAEDVIAFDMWDGQSCRGRAWRAAIRDWLTGLAPDEQVEVRFSGISVFADSAVAGLCATAEYRALGPGGETLRRMANRFSWICRREGAGLKVCHQHTSVPVDGELRAVL